MALTPIGILKRATRAALRRRYGYAALRIVRAAIRRALQEHLRRMFEPEPYSIDPLEIRWHYFRTMRQLRRRWPDLNPTDPRAEPPCD